MCKTYIIYKISSIAGYKIYTFIMPTNMWDVTWRQQWRHLLSKET